MSAIYSDKDYLHDPFLATIELGRLLANSSLQLFLGAGVSSGFGLPEWREFIARVLGRDGDSAFMKQLNSTPITDLRRLLDPIDDGKEDYFKAVHVALYRDVNPNLLKQLQVSPLLLAIAAMMTGAHRGRVDSVVTYNYDDLLEQYLIMLGLAVCRRMLPNDLSTRADVELNYVHGRLPQRWKPSADEPEIILSEKSYRHRRAEIDEGWSALVTHSLASKIALFVGLSGDDSSILDVLQRAKKRVNRGAEYIGYWILTPEAFDRNKNDILDVGVCPIQLSKDSVADFIFTICQQAAN